jgi:hypothetical protein
MDVQIDVKKKAPGVYINEKSVTMNGELISEADRIKARAELWHEANDGGNGNPTIVEVTHCDFNCDFDNDFLRCGCADTEVELS